MPTTILKSDGGRGEPRNDAEELARRVQAGERRAEGALVAHFSNSLMTILLRRTDGDRPYAEDVHQETFRIVLERLRAGQVSEPQRIAGFIHGTARLLIKGDRRKLARRKTHSDTDQIQRVVDGAPNALERLLAEQSDSAVRQLIKEMPNLRDRDLLYSYYILDVEKIALCDRLDLSPRHFDRVISRARRRFRELVNRGREEPGSVATALLGAAQKPDA